MATIPKKKIGHIKCLCCGERNPLLQADNGTINLSCKECDFAGYARKGTEAYNLVMKTAVLIAAPAAALPAAAPAAKPAKTPAPAATLPPALSAASALAALVKKNTVFG